MRLFFPTPALDLAFGEMKGRKPLDPSTCTQWYPRRAEEPQSTASRRGLSTAASSSRWTVHFRRRLHWTRGGVLVSWRLGSFPEVLPAGNPAMILCGPHIRLLLVLLGLLCPAYGKWGDFEKIGNPPARSPDERNGAAALGQGHLDKSTLQLPTAQLAAAAWSGSRSRKLRPKEKKKQGQRGEGKVKVVGWGCSASVESWQGYMR